MSKSFDEKIKAHKLAGTMYDRRRKLSDDDKRDIQDLYNFEHLPIREIARRYEHICSRRMIQFVVFPERDKKLKEKVSKEKRWKKYNDRKTLTKAKNSWLKYKSNLIKNKII